MPTRPAKNKDRPLYLELSAGHRAMLDEIMRVEGRTAKSAIEQLILRWGFSKPQPMVNPAPEPLGEAPLPEPPPAKAARRRAKP